MVLDLRYIAVTFFASVTVFVTVIYSLQKAVAAGGKRQGTPQRSADPNPREYARACAPASACSNAPPYARIGRGFGAEFADWRARIQCL